MMTTRIGLMGFGRIGRNVLRLLHNRADLDIVAISDIADPEALTYLLKYDSIYGRFPALCPMPTARCPTVTEMSPG